MASTTLSNDPVAGLPDRIQLRQTYDAARLQQEVTEIVDSLSHQLFIYYMAVELARSVASPTEHDWASEPMLKGCDYLQQIFAQFETEITSIRLMRLDAGAVLKEHTDPMLDAVHRDVVRLTLPVFSYDDVLFLLNGSHVAMQPGTLWYLKLSERHSVHNNTPYERINMSIDVKWNDWVEATIRGAL